MDLQNTLSPSPKKKKIALAGNDAIIEAGKSVSSDVADGVKNLASDVVASGLDSLFGTYSTVSKKTSGILEPNKTVSLCPEQNQPVEAPKEPSNILEAGKGVGEIQLWSKKQMMVENELREIRIELVKLIKVLKDLPFELAETVKSNIAHPGEYHLNFLLRIKSLIKTFRLKVEESKTWFNFANNRKEQKNYWNMFKKHGTTFGMSSERSIATAAG